MAPLMAGLFVARLSAQDCRIWQMAQDNPFSDSRHYTQPRIAWHAEKAAASWVGVTVARKLHAPKWARVVPALVVTALHVRGTIRRTYRVNAADWIADAWIVSLPFLPRTVAAVSYLPAACYASP